MEEQDTKIGTSLAVRQFFAIASGRVAVHRPVSEFRVVKAEAEECYCLYCFGIFWHDMLRGAVRTVRVCRVCGLGVEEC